MKKIILAGGSGFVGNYLMRFFPIDEYEIVVLSRTNKTLSRKNCKTVVWDAKSLQPTWQQELEGAEAVINLTGRSINCFFSEKNKAEILNSRVQSTHILGTAISQAKNPPKHWINASAVGFYPSDYAKEYNETDLVPNPDFIGKVCQEWEAACNAFQLPKTKKIILRLGVVFGQSEGAFQKLKTLVLWGQGGKQGNGKQYLSWLHVHDLARIIDFLLQQNQEGVFNATAPHPLSNNDLMTLLRIKLHRIIGIPAPAFLIQLMAPIIGIDASIILKGQRVVPKRLLAMGFHFSYPNASNAVDELIGITPSELK